MTYYWSQALLAIPAGRLRRHLAVPSAQARSHGSPSGCVKTAGQASHSKKRKGHPNGVALSLFRSLAMTYSHMGKPHTTIGDVPFHY